MFSINHMGRHGSRMAIADVDIQMATIILTMVRSANSVQDLLLSDGNTYVNCDKYTFLRIPIIIYKPFIIYLHIRVAQIHGEQLKNLFKKKIP